MPKGTESDVEQGAGLLGSEQLAALFSANITAKADPEFHDDAGEGVVTSGVLDIRALADAYESEFRKMEAESAVEEPPMVSQTGLGLLIPQAEPEKEAPRVPYLLFAMIALLLVAGTAAATAFIVKRGAPAAAAVPTAEQCAQLAQAPAATPPGSLPPATAPQAVAPAVVPPAASAAEPKVVTETQAKPEVAAVASKPEREETPEEREAREARREARRLEREAAEAKAAETPVAKTEKIEPVVEEKAEPAPPAEPAKEAKEEKAKPADGCDEVACLVDPNGPCCAKKAKKEVAKADTESELPERLTAKDVNAGLRPMRGRIDSCGDKNGFAGTAKLKMTIAPSGSVSSASVAEGNAGFQSCLTGHVKDAKFAETQKGMTITYPIVFR